MQQQLPSAASHFSAQPKKGTDHTNKLGQNDFFMDNPYYTLCTQIEHSFPPSPVTETREGGRGRPQLPSGAVFACSFTGEPIGLVTSSLWPFSSVCRG